MIMEKCLMEYFYDCEYLRITSFWCCLLREIRKMGEVESFKINTINNIVSCYNLLNVVGRKKEKKNV